MQTFLLTNNFQKNVRLWGKFSDFQRNVLFNRLFTLHFPCPKELSEAKSLFLKEEQYWKFSQTSTDIFSAALSKLSSRCQSNVLGRKNVIEKLPFVFYGICWENFRTMRERLSTGFSKPALCVSRWNVLWKLFCRRKLQFRIHFLTLKKNFRE